MTELNPKNLLVMCFDSLGAAYQAVQLAGEDIDVLEVFPVGSRGHLIFSSEKPLNNLFVAIFEALKSHVLHASHIEKCPAKVLRAYLSVENAQVDKHLVLIEATYVGDLVSAAADGVNSGLKVVDLRMLRGASSSSYMFLTGDEFALQKLSEKSKLKATLIKNVNQHILNLFNI